MNELLKTQARRRSIPSVRYAGFAVLPTVQRPHKGTADTAAQEEPQEEKEVTIIVLCVMLIILFVIALAVTAFLCWVSATAFNWGIVALVWLILLVIAVFIGGGDGWE